MPSDAGTVSVMAAGPTQRLPRTTGGTTSWVLALACAAQFMVVLDISVVNVALPSMKAALGFTPTALQWVVNSYALVFAGFLLLGGRLADLYGRKRIFVLGLAAFSAASLVGGLASAPGTLIAARAVQGLGAAVLAPASLTILTTTFPEGHRRTRALATWTAVGIGGGTAGNLLGGVLTQYLTWRSTLLINVPLGALAILISTHFLTESRRLGRRRRLDAPGAVLATLSLAALTLGITQSQSQGWSHPVTVGSLVIGLLGLVSFVVVEARFAPAPLIPLRLFRVRAISTGNVAMLLAGACFMPMWYFLSLFMQDVLHYSALQTGLGFLPHTVVTMIVAARLTPWLMTHVNSRPLIIIGALIAATGFWWQSRATPDSTYLHGILGPAITFSLGAGLLNTPLTTTALSGVHESEAGAASGLMNTTKQIGGALGLAVLVTIAASELHTPQALAADYSRTFLTIAAILIATAAAGLSLPARRDATVAPTAGTAKNEQHDPQ